MRKIRGVVMVYFHLFVQKIIQDSKFIEQFIFYILHKHSLLKINTLLNLNQNYFRSEDRYMYLYVGKGIRFY